MSIVKDIDSKNTKSQFYKFDPFTTIILLLIVFFTGQFISALIISIYPKLVGMSSEQSSEWLTNSSFAQFIFILIAELISIYLIFNLVKLAKKKIEEIKIVKPILKDVGMAIIAYIPYMILLIIVMAIISNFTNIDLNQKQQIGFENAKTGIDLFFTFLSLVVIVPLSEEIMFRGFLFSSMRSKYNFWISVIITSIIFGLAHLQLGSDAPPLWSVAIDTFLLSSILCYLAEKRKSIWPSVFLHSIKNLVAFIALFGINFIN